MTKQDPSLPNAHPSKNDVKETQASARVVELAAPPKKAKNAPKQSKKAPKKPTAKPSASQNKKRKASAKTSASKKKTIRTTSSAAPKKKAPLSDTAKKPNPARKPSSASNASPDLGWSHLWKSLESVSHLRASQVREKTYAALYEAALSYANNAEKRGKAVEECLKKQQEWQHLFMEKNAEASDLSQQAHHAERHYQQACYKELSAYARNILAERRIARAAEESKQLYQQLALAQVERQLAWLQLWKKASAQAQEPIEQLKNQLHDELEQYWHAS